MTTAVNLSRQLCQAMATCSARLALAPTTAGHQTLPYMCLYPPAGNPAFGTDSDEATTGAGSSHKAINKINSNSQARRCSCRMHGPDTQRYATRSGSCVAPLQAAELQPQQRLAALPLKPRFWAEVGAGSMLQQAHLQCSMCVQATLHADTCVQCVDVHL